MSFFRKFWTNTSNKHKKLRDCNELESYVRSHRTSFNDDGQIEKIFKLKYLGSTIVSGSTKTNAEKTKTKAVQNILRFSHKKRWKRMPASVPVLLQTSAQGVTLLDPITNFPKLHVSVNDISCCSTVASNDRIFSFVASDNSNDTLELHAFMCKNRKLTETVTLAVATIFQIAYEQWQNECNVCSTNTACDEQFSSELSEPESQSEKDLLLCS